MRTILVGSAVLAALGVSALGAQEAAPRRRVFGVPVLGYTPETSLLFGVALVGVTSPGDGAATRPSTGLAQAIYTLKRQYSLSVFADRWTAGNRWRLTGETGISRFPSEYHGIGADATDTSETYTPRVAYVTTTAQRRVSRQVFVGVGYAIRHATIVKTVAGGRLASGVVLGSRGGTEAAVTVDGVWDTRDALYRTQRGAYVRLAYGVAGKFVGGDHAFRRLTADARAYRGVGRGVVLAAQATADAVDGSAPFDLLPRLGGQNILRGFTEPRFRDNAMAAGHVELRAPLKGVVSLTAFGGGGAVASSLGAIPDARLRVAGGMGLRFLLDAREGLQLRVDYAVARGGGGLYIAAGDAF